MAVPLAIDCNTVILFHSDMTSINELMMTVQAFEAPWPIIQANAIYLCSCIIAFSNDQHIAALYHNQVDLLSFNRQTNFTRNTLLIRFWMGWDIWH